MTGGTLIYFTFFILFFSAGLGKLCFSTYIGFETSWNAARYTQSRPLREKAFDGDQRLRSKAPGRRMHFQLTQAPVRVCPSVELAFRIMDTFRLCVSLI